MRPRSSRESGPNTSRSSSRFHSSGGKRGAGRLQGPVAGAGAPRSAAPNPIAPPAGRAASAARGWR